jgi:HAD superfamily hydrolase (TIGR01490 family)
MTLAIFDFDGTLLTVDTLPYLLRLWRVLKYPRLRLLQIYGLIGGLYIRFKLSANSKAGREQMKKTALQKFTRIFAGMTKAQVGAFFDRCIQPILDKLNPAVVSELEAAKARGCHTVILSGCYEDLLRRVGDRLGVDTVLGTQMVFCDDIVDVLHPLDIGTGIDKVHRIRAAYGDEADYTASYAYADSISDMPILELVGHPVAVAPDPGLKEVAAQRRWRVIG